MKRNLYTIIEFAIYDEKNIIAIILLGENSYMEIFDHSNNQCYCILSKNNRITHKELSRQTFLDHSLCSAPSKKVYPFNLKYGNALYEIHLGVNSYMEFIDPVTYSLKHIKTSNDSYCIF